MRTMLSRGTRRRIAVRRKFLPPAAAPRLRSDMARLRSSRTRCGEVTAADRCTLADHAECVDDCFHFGEQRRTRGDLVARPPERRALFVGLLFAQLLVFPFAPSAFFRAQLSGFSAFDAHRMHELSDEPDADVDPLVQPPNQHLGLELGEAALERFRKDRADASLIRRIKFSRLFHEVIEARCRYFLSHRLVRDSWTRRT